MSRKRCVRCGGSNVDFEGYCWTCEHQVEQATPDEVTGGRRPAVARPARKPSPAGRFLVMIVAPITTIVVIGVCFLGVLAFNKADALVGAGAAPSVMPPATATSGPPPGSAEACLIGTWRIASLEETTTLEGGRTLHVTGSGGTLVLRADGTGSLDHGNSSLTGLLEGVTVTVKQQGVETFRYRVAGAALIVDQRVGDITLSVLNQGILVAQERQTAISDAIGGNFGCGGNSLALRGKRGVPGTDYYEFNETFTRDH